MSFLKLPKQFHPDFQQPNKKPLNGIKLDYSSDLVRGLVLDVEMDEGGGSPRDLVTGELLTSNGQGWDIRDGDRETTYAVADNDHLSLSGLEDFSGSSHTIHMRVRIDNFDTAGLVILGWNNNGTHFWQVDDVLTTVFIAGTSLDTTASAHEGATGIYRDWVFVSDGDANESRFKIL